MSIPVDLTQLETAAARAARQLAGWRASACCTPLQGRLALGQVRWQQVETVLAAPTTPWSLRQSIAAAQIWKRMSPDIATMANLLGMTDPEVDELFRLAVTLTE